MTEVLRPRFGGRPPREDRRLKLLSPPRPSCPFASLQEFRKSRCTPSSAVNDPTFWPCLTCNGEGSVTDWDEYCGGPYSRPNRKTCVTCKGTGRSGRPTVEKAYKKVIDQWRSEAATWDMLAGYFLALSDKLTAEEALALKHFLPSAHKLPLRDPGPEAWRQPEGRKE